MAKGSSALLRTSGDRPRTGVPEMRLCLDFVNTEGAVRNEPPDRLETVELFIEWASGHGLGELRAPDDARGRELLTRGRELRESLYRTFAAITRAEQPDADDLSTLNRALAEALPRLRLASGTDGISWTFAERGRTLEDAFDLVAISAANLLTSELLARVKECDSETCAWLFIDESRNRSRRWCDMSDCGNRAKARRFYRRHASTDTSD